MRQEQLKVLLVETLPRWEFRYLKNALSRDPGVTVRVLLMHPGMDRGEGKNLAEILRLRAEFPALRSG